MINSATCLPFLSIIDGEPRFGGTHHYQPAARGRRATPGGGAYHTATLTVAGEASVLKSVSDVARGMGLHVQ